MTTAADSLKRLDNSLAQHGTGSIKISRGAVSVTVPARCCAAKSDEIVVGGSSGQIVYKAIISGTGLETFGAPKKNDKVLYNGAERTVLWADPQSYNGTLVRVNFQFAG